jgi:lipoprotein-releasing system permease protein
MSGFPWMTAWRHLRAQRVPRWLPVTAAIAAVLVLVGGALVAAWALRPPPGMLAGPVPEPTASPGLLLGSLSLGTGALVLAFCALARVFNLLATIVTFSVAQGCMALVLVLGLMGGLEDDLRGRLLDHKAHVRIARADGGGFVVDDELLAVLAARPEVAGASSVLEGEILVRTAWGRQGATLLGVDPDRHATVTALPREVEQGSYAFMTAPERIPWLAPPPTEPFPEGPVPPATLPPDDADPSSEKTDPTSPDPPKADPPATSPTPDETDDGGWEDPSVEIPRLRAEGRLPPPAPVAETTAIGEPDAEESDDDGWEDPSVEIPRLRAEGKLPPPVEPALPADVPAGTPVAPDDVVEPPQDLSAVDLPPVLLGRELAADLNIGLGDPLQLITPVGRITPQGVVPGVLMVRVAGVFFTGIYDFDRKHLYLPLPAAQTFQRAGAQVHAVEVRLRDGAAIDAGKAAVEAAVAGRELVVEDWRDQNRDLFAAMFLEKAAMFIALVFVILVAAFGILATNLMSVLEKAPEIAILKAMGARDGEVARIFALEGLVVGVLGSLGGIAAGVGLGVVLGVHGLPIDEGVFYLERLPIRIEPVEVAAVAVIGLVIVALSSVVPARSAARLRPVDGLRLRDE